jgi:hypothetical protein
MGSVPSGAAHTEMFVDVNTHGTDDLRQGSDSQIRGMHGSSDQKASWEITTAVDNEEIEKARGLLM